MSRNENRLRQEIEAGIEEYFSDDDEQFLDNDGQELVNEPDEDLKADVSHVLAPLNRIIEQAKYPEQLEQVLLARWIGMVSLAKTWGRQDYNAAEIFVALVMAKVIDGVSLDTVYAQYELNEWQDDEIDEIPQEEPNFFDILRIGIESSDLTQVVRHASLRDKDQLHTSNSPVPLFKPEVLKAFKHAVSSFEVVGRISHNRQYSGEKNETQARVFARAEYLAAIRYVLRAGVDIEQLLDVIFKPSKEKNPVIAFVKEHSELSLRSLAEKWGNERAEMSDLSWSLHIQTMIQEEIAADGFSEIAFSLSSERARWMNEGISSALTGRS